MAAYSLSHYNIRSDIGFSLAKKNFFLQMPEIK